MDKYYGVQRSEDYLAHYGIRGMKWGIRKAVDKTGSVHRSKAYLDAEKKLKRATYAGGIVGGLAYAAKHKDEFKRLNNSQRSAALSVKRKKSSNVKLSSKDKDFVRGMNKAANKGGAIGALTVGGGALGGAISTARYIKQHPKEYAAYKKKYKQMGLKDRMKASFGRV